MDDPILDFRCAVGRMADRWIARGLPSRQGLDEAANRLRGLRASLKVPGLWQDPPSMVTATLDDGLGQGLSIIESFGHGIGMQLISLGLMQSVDAVVDACRRHRPQYLGVTILQFDTEEALTAISGAIPAHTRIVAGGPVFAGDPDFAERTGTHYAARNVADFLRLMLGTCGEC